MARVAILSEGRIRIGDIEKPFIETIITPDGGVISAEVKSKITIAASSSKTFDLSIAGPDSILLGMTTGLSFAWLRGTDSSGDSFPFKIEWNSQIGTVDIATCTEFLWSVNVATVVVSFIVITNLSSSEILTLEYVFAGQ